MARAMLFAIGAGFMVERPLDPIRPRFVRERIDRALTDRTKRVGFELAGHSFPKNPKNHRHAQIVPALHRDCKEGARFVGEFDTAPGENIARRLH